MQPRSNSIFSHLYIYICICVISLQSIQRNYNSFLVIQLIEDDSHIPLSVNSNSYMKVLQYNSR